jgi:hypothetical protein
MPEGYAQHGIPARVYGVRRPRLGARFGSATADVSDLLAGIYALNGILTYS